jgi:ribosomal protein S18 acetylase RimI-like enzyme
MDTLPHSANAAAERAAVTVRIAAADELPEVLRVQHEAFRRVAAAFGIPEDRMQPITETLGEIQALHAAGVRTFVALEALGETERVVGTVRAAVRTDGPVEIGRLAVAGSALRRGVATALMLTLEESYPEAERFVLFTGADAAEPLALYDRLGYRIFRTQSFGDFGMVWLEKVRPGASAPHGAPLH